MSPGGTDLCAPRVAPDFGGLPPSDRCMARLHFAGFSPVLKFLKVASSMMTSMRARTSLAITGIFFQIGFSTAKMSEVCRRSTLIFQIVLQWLRTEERYFS